MASDRSEPAAQDALQSLCEEGSEALVQTHYLLAERLLAEAEAKAWDLQDWDTLSRLYMPLQECRRQKRQKCGEGQVALDLVSMSAGETLHADMIVDRFPSGQLLVAGWKSADPARRVRDLAAERGLYLETFLAAVVPIDGPQALAVVIVPSSHVELPLAEQPVPWEELIERLPAGCQAIPFASLPRGVARGSPTTFARTMSIWECLHAPFLAAGDAETNLLARMSQYRKTIAVDYACELAHQRLSATAAELSRR